MRWDESGALVVQGRLTPEQGALFLEALAKATEDTREAAHSLRMQKRFSGNGFGRRSR